MLFEIRQKLQKVAAMAIIGLLVLAFASWGITDYVSGLSQTNVAKVDGTNITLQAFSRAQQIQEQRYRNTLGENYQPGLLDDPVLKMALVQQLIDDHLQISDAQESGYRVSNEELSKRITALEVFQGSDGFDRNLYKNLLRQQGLSISQFEQDLAESIIAGQVRSAITNGPIITDQELEQLLKLQGEQRDLKFLLLNRENYLSQAQATDEQIEAYYREHLDRFQKPEQVRIEWLELVLDDYAEQVEIEDSTLRKLYENQQEEYRKPERRRASHLLVTVDEQQDEAAALAKITSLKAEIDAGKPFAEVARNHSEDPGSSKNGGDLGLFGRDVMDPAFEKVAFSLATGEVSEPVRSAFGYHLILVTEVETEQVEPYAEVKDEISLRYRREQAQADFFSATEELQNIVYEVPDSLQEAADHFNLKIQESQLFARFGGPGITGISAIIEQAFSDEVLHEGLNSSVVTLNDSRAVALRVIEHQPQASRPLAEVADSIRDIVLEQQASELVQAEGKKLLVSLNHGEELPELADASATWQTREGITRRQPGLPPQLLAEVFRQPVSEGQPDYHGLSLENGDYVVYAVTKLHEEVVTATDDDRNRLREELQRLRGDISYIGYLKGLRDNADIKLYPENLE